MLKNDDLLNELQDCRRSMISRVLGLTPSKISSFIDEGVPWYNSSTQTCNLIDAVHWYMRINSGEESTLKGQKLQKEIELKDAQIQKINDTVIDRAEHEKILCSRAAAMRQFMEQTALLSATKFVDLSLDQARGQLLQLFTKAMDSYCGESSSVEQDILDLS